MAPSRTTNNIYTCKLCRFSSSRNQDVLRHHSNRHGNSYYQCPACDNQSKQYEHFKTHWRTKHMGELGMIFGFLCGRGKVADATQSKRHCKACKACQEYQRTTGTCKTYIRLASPAEIEPLIPKVEVTTPTSSPPAQILVTQGELPRPGTGNGQRSSRSRSAEIDQTAPSTIPPAPAMIGEIGQPSDTQVFDDQLARYDASFPTINFDELDMLDTSIPADTDVSVQYQPGPIHPGLFDTTAAPANADSFNMVPSPFMGAWPSAQEQPETIDPRILTIDGSSSQDQLGDFNSSFFDTTPAPTDPGVSNMQAAPADPAAPFAQGQLGNDDAGSAPTEPAQDLIDAEGLRLLREFCNVD